MSTYRYSTGDPRGEPTWYMYSQVEGLAFLHAWAESRRAAMTRLAATAAVSDDPVVALLAGDRPRSGTRPPPLRGPVRTEPLLRELIAAERSGGMSGEVLDWTIELARKYEIARRLRAAYGADLRPAVSDEPPPAVYGMLAALLARWGESTGDLRALNALLKVNDLLIAIEPQLDAVAAAGACVGVTAELRAIGALATSCGIDLGAPT